MLNKIRILTLQFNLPIKLSEVPYFRGAVLKSIGGGADVLFHNHQPESGYRYSYPLIQYKRLGRNAAIVCIERGTEMVGQFLSRAPEQLRLGEREVELNLFNVRPTRVLVQIWNTMSEYHISRWLPLNSKNLSQYMAIEDEQERISMLERILKANLLSMLKGLNIYLEQELLLRITELDKPRKLLYKDVGMLAFNAQFVCNLSIPDNLGVGKNASVGFGVVHRKRETQEQA